jgi:uncharacterized delta-60 repeat protein
MKRLAFLALALGALAACGDDSSSNPNPDASIDATQQADASVDAPPSFTKPTPFAVALSAMGPDQLQAAVAGPSGTFYAAGFAAATPTGAKAVVVVKIKGDGTLDTAFGGGDGIATTDLVFVGSNDEIDLVVAPGGKILVSATVLAGTANPDDANDTDVGITRLNADGTTDTTFAVGGKRILSLNTSTLVVSGTPPVTSATARDAARSIAVDATGRIYIHGAQRGLGNKVATPPLDPPQVRSDTDYVVARLTANGDPDLTFGATDGDVDGKVLRDIYVPATSTHSSATARAVIVLPNGSVLGTGYASNAGLGSAPQPVLYKLTSTGSIDPDFAQGGLFFDTVLAGQTEVYGGAIHGDYLVTAGYGRASGSINDWVSLRFHVYTGARDMTWGGTANGASMVAPSTRASNCRNAIALPNGKTALIGSTGSVTGTTPMPPMEAAFAILDASGKLDPKFGGAAQNYELKTGGANQFWGGAVSGGKALLVGYSGVSTQTDAANDNAYGVLLTVE